MRCALHPILTGLLGAVTLSVSACDKVPANQQQIVTEKAIEAIQHSPPAMESRPGGMTTGQNGAGMGSPPDGMGPPGGMGGPDESSDLIPTAQVTYKTVEGGDLKLHIFNPDGHKAGDNRTALVFFHGGGFRFGSPQAGYDLSETLNAKDIVLISAEYRLVNTEERTLDHIISDAKSAIRYVRSHANKLGVNPNKIISVGHSAGAYLSAATGMIDGFDEVGDNMNVSARSNAMILWSMSSNRSERNTGEIIAQGRTLEDYQPRAHIDSNLPPSLFIHGDSDQLIAYGPTQELMGEIKAKGNETEFLLIKDADHFFRSEPQRSQAITAISDFLTELENK